MSIKASLKIARKLRRGTRHKAVSDAAGQAKPWRHWLKLAAGVLLLVTGLGFAWQQPPHPNVWRTIGSWDIASKDWWLYPIERNAFKRLPTIQGDLNAMHADKDGKHIWVAGEGGLIVHSMDGGKTWLQQHPLPANITPDLQRNATWSLFGYAWAGEANRSEPPTSKQQPRDLLRESAQSPQQPFSQELPSGSQSELASTRDNTTPIATKEVSPASGTTTQTTDTLVAPETPNPLPTAVTAEQQSRLAEPGKATPQHKKPAQGPAVGQQSALASIDKSFLGRLLVLLGINQAKTIGVKPAATTPNHLPTAADQERAHLYAITFVDAQTGWAVGERGTILTTNDGGENWALQSSKVRNQLNSVQFLDKHLGWIAGTNGLVLSTSDGGQSWRKLNTRTTGQLTSIFFITPEHGWASGPVNAFLETRDAGKSWIDRSQDISSASPKSLYFQGNYGWGARAELLLITDDRGESWASKIVDARLNAVQFTDSKLGWAVGDSGAILNTTDGGNVWSQQKSGTTGQLTAINFVSPNIGWVVGKNGLILASRDGGKHWHPQTLGGKEMDPAITYDQTYRIYPAPWVYLVFILGAGLACWAIWKLRGTPSSTPSPGIADVFVSDEPLDPEAKDYLGHDLVAKGLANYLLNRNTAPSLTLAVTGSWGSGKSSIMRRLEYLLRQEGFRPAWFNAWHHQQEGRQLASMLNTIRKQAVPRWYTPAGWRVRMALNWHRGWLYKLLTIALLGLLLVGITQAPKLLDDWPSTQSTLRAAINGAKPVVITPTSLQQLRNGGVLEQDALDALSANFLWANGTGKPACKVEGGDCKFESMDQLIVSLEKALNPRKLTDEEKQALQQSARHINTTSETMLGVLLGSLIIPLLLGKGLAVYGFNYLDLIKRLLPEHGKMEGKEAVGTIERFREEFCRLTQALDERLVLFIDDLDRCDCETAREVLELVNYLTSVGKCFVVLGMAMEHVMVCIPARNDEQQGNYAKQYLRKLINIEVPVPQLNLEKSKAMLEGQANENFRPANLGVIRAWGVRLAATLAVFLAAWLMSQTWQWVNVKPEPKVIVQIVNKPQAAESKQPSVDASATTEPQDPSSERQVGVILPHIAEPSKLPTWLAGGLGLILIGATAWFSRQRWLAWLQERGWFKAIKIKLGGVERKEDSDDFVSALAAWHPIIVEGDPTPRGMKRFVNRVRFLAMMEEVQDDDRIPDDLLVAMAALHHSHARHTDNFEAFKVALNQSRVFEANDPQNYYLNMLLDQAIKQTPAWPPSKAQWTRFQQLVEHMHIH